MSIDHPKTRALDSSESTLRGSIRKHLLVGTGLAALLVVGAGGWAATADIAGAVIAPGTLVADSRVKSVQHPTGGVVGAVLVEDGDRVEAGQLLLRLDDTVHKAGLAIITQELDQLLVRGARFAAERDGTAAITLPAAIAPREAEPEVAAIVTAESKIFDIRRKSRENLKAQLRERIAQLRNELAANEVQQASTTAELALAREELATSQELRDKQLNVKSVHLAVQRQVTRLEGATGQIEAAKAQVLGKIAETELQMLQIDRDLEGEAGEELRGIELRVAELQQRRIANEDQLRRTELRAPQAGIIHQSRIHTVGGVIAADGEPIMRIVPAGDDLTVEARVQPQDIDQIKAGESALLRFSAFSQRTTPEINGVVDRVSGDTTVDPQTGISFYTIRIRLAAGEITRLGKVNLVPGMPVEAFIRTGERTVLSHLLKPFTDQVQRAFRQD